MIVETQYFASFEMKGKQIKDGDAGIASLQLVMVHFINDRACGKYDQAYSRQYEQVPPKGTLGFYATGNKPTTLALPGNSKNDKYQAACSSNNFMKHFIKLILCELANINIDKFVVLNR